jgi:glycosyltransferase involved in cell wall biosynthesis
VYLGRSIAVVMPAYNVADRIGEAIAGVPGFVDHHQMDDDGSHDRTAQVAAAQQRPGLCLLRHPRNRGVGAAIASGYAEALRLGADVTSVMAGDGQMDPTDLPELIKPIALGHADYVKGNRFRRREVWRVMPKDRLLGNIVLSLLTKLTSGYWRSFDSQCGYTAISRRALQALGSDFFARYGYPNDVLARLRALGARLEERSVRPIYDGQRSGIRFWMVIYPILFVLLRSFGRRLWRQHLRPLLLGQPAASLRFPIADSPERLLAHQGSLPLPCFAPSTDRCPTLRCAAPPPLTSRPLLGPPGSPPSSGPPA